MANSLGLSLYLLAAGRRSGAAAGVVDMPRPKGSLIWFHVPAEGPVPATIELMRRIQDEDATVSFLFTVSNAEGAAVAQALVPSDLAIVQLVPPESPSHVQAFLAHWHPEVAVMVQGQLRPALVEGVHNLGTPLFLIDAEAPDLGGLRWLPGLGWSMMQKFRRILARDEQAARSLRRNGAPPERVSAPGRLEQSAGTLTYTEAERAVLARMLQTRPIWLAACLPPSEEEAVIAAHRSALRLAHRLLLIIVPEDLSRAESLASEIEAGQGWTIARRSLDEDPEDDTQVYIADTEGEYGLWYRLAPITYLGGSLLGGGCRRNPFEPASLGSAIVHGTQTAPFAEALGRLDRAGAARPLRGPGDLGEAVGDLLSPDRAAQLAHNAWLVSSSGAEVAEVVVRMLLSTLDEVVAKR